MEISGRILREVEFRDRLRGYDTEEVDDFLEKVAVGVDDLVGQIEAAREAASRVDDDAIDDESLRRTLVLAQRTADLAIKEARDEASAMLEDARAQAEELVGSARQEASRLREEAHTKAKETVAELEERKSTLSTEVAEITNFIESLRKQLVFALQGALETVGESLKPPAPTPTSVRKRLEAVAKTVEEEPPQKRERASRSEEDDDLAGPATEAVAASELDGEEDEDASGKKEDLAALADEIERRTEEKSKHARREERSSSRDQKGTRGDEEGQDDLEAFSMTGEEAIVGVENVVDPDEELWQRWAKGAELDSSTEEEQRPARSNSRAERRGGGFSD
ncbi:MAG: DivIVA domain-containing protein [Acidimicrobiales bacterium]